MKGQTESRGTNRQSVVKEVIVQGHEVGRTVDAWRQIAYVMHASTIVCSKSRLQTAFTRPKRPLWLASSIPIDLDTLEFHYVRHGLAHKQRWPGPLFRHYKASHALRSEPHLTPRSKRPAALPQSPPLFLSRRPRHPSLQMDEFAAFIDLSLEPTSLPSSTTPTESSPDFLSTPHSDDMSMLSDMERDGGGYISFCVIA